MKKVLHVIDSLERGGAETLLVTFLQRCDPHHHQVVALSGENHFIRELAEFTIHSLHCSSRTDFLKAPRKIGNAARAMSADIIHAHLFVSGLMSSQVRLGKMKLVVHLHNRISRSVFQEKPHYRHLEKVLYRRRDAMVFVSEEVKKDYYEQVGAVNRGRVIYNAVGKAFCETPVHPPKKGKHWVSVGSLKKQKNVQQLCEGFGPLAKEGYQLTIIGDGPLREELKDWIDKHRWSNIHLAGSQVVTPEYLQTFNGFISLSNYEGFGIAAAEALCCGLPLTLSDIPVYREVFGSVARFVPIRSERSSFRNQLHQALESTADHTIEIEAIRSKLHPENFYRQILDLYEELD